MRSKDVPSFRHLSISIVAPSTGRMRWLSKYLIDPHNIISYNRTDEELELLWLFAGVAAGKTAKTQARLLNNFLSNLRGDSPFDKVQIVMIEANLRMAIQESHLGQYNRLTAFMADSVIKLRRKLRTCTVEELEDIYGAGPKTARMFLMFSRANQRLAALDTHVLKHLRAEGYDAPKSTPTGRKYVELENVFLRLADKAGMSPADYDIMIWRKYNASAKNRSPLGV